MADTAGQTLSTTKARNQRQIDLGLAEPGFVAGDNHVARHRQLQSPAQRETIDRRDNRDR